VVALALLLGGMPPTLGIAVHSSEAMFTPDICQATQLFSHSPVSVVGIIPSSPAVTQFLPEARDYPPALQAQRVRAAATPDPPPPEARV
jgi:hypothetical protein